MKYNLFCFLLVSIFTAIIITSCAKKLDPGPGSFTVAFANMDLRPANLLPGDTSTQSHAIGFFNIMGDSTLSYDLTFLQLLAGEVPNSVSIYSGDPVSNGSQLLNISNVDFSHNNEAIGKVSLPSAVRDSFANTALMYAVIASSTHPNGLVRGFIGRQTSISFAKDIQLATDSIKPKLTGITTTATVYLRLLSTGTTLYSKVVVNNLPAGDTLLTASIRSRINDGVLQQLAGVYTDFNITKNITIAATVGTAIANLNTYYIDIRTKKYPNGLVRGYY